jgi:hypothetical protein
MKWIVFSLFVLGIALPVSVSAQVLVPINPIVKVGDNSHALWGIGGHEIILVKAGDGDMNPYMRTELLDARTVEILSRTQAPPLQEKDIKVVSRNGRNMIVVRRYLLFDVKPQDARAERTTTTALAQKWAASVRKALPAIAPAPSKFGI